MSQASCRKWLRCGLSSYEQRHTNIIMATLLVTQVQGKWNVVANLCACSHSKVQCYPPCKFRLHFLFQFHYLNFSCQFLDASCHICRVPPINDAHFLLCELCRHDKCHWTCQGTWGACCSADPVNMWCHTCVSFFPRNRTLFLIL